MFRAQVVCDSINPDGHRLTTFRVEFPKYLQQEINTHKIVNRSAASSRATPVDATLAKLLGATATDKRPTITADPFTPLKFGLNEGGMQSRRDAEGMLAVEAKEIWLSAITSACRHAAHLHRIGIHKQFVNRIVEPYCWTRCVLTATDWANFFALRTHEDAEPHFQMLARCMYVAYKQSKPVSISYGEWHLPFINKEERDSPTLGWNMLCKLSSARCARVSYSMMERLKKPTQEDDLDLFGRLVDRHPKHMGPLEHQGQAVDENYFKWNPQHRSNLRGYVQFRKTIPGENITEFNPTEQEIEGWNVPATALEPWGDETV